MASDENDYENVQKMSEMVESCGQFMPPNGVPQPKYEKDLKKIKCNQCIILLFLTLLTILSITILSGHLSLLGMKAPQGEFHQQGQETHILRKKNCQSGWTPFRGYCYKTFPSQRLPWYDAEFFCVQHMNGCHLPSIHDEEEYQFVLQLWPEPRPERIWFGGRYSHLKGKVIWTDESSWDFDKFADGEPNNLNTTESCIEHHGGLNGWNDASGETKLSVLCKCTF